MNVRMPDGTIIKGIPEGTSPDEIEATWQRSKGPSASRKEGRATGGGEQGALTALNGLTFGFGDEIAGGLNAARYAITGRDGAEGYQSGRDYVRGAVEQYKKDQPILGPVADISGSLLQSPLMVAKVAQAPGAIRQLLSAMGIGAATGAAQGAGDAETMGDVAGAAAQGGMIGGVGAGVLHGGAKVMMGGTDQFLPRFSGTAASELAKRRLATSLVRDEATGDQVAARLSKLGDEGTIADAAGQNTRNLLDTLATLPGKTQNQTEKLIRNRQITRADRLDDIPNALGGGRAGDDVLAALQEAKEKAAGPLYAKVDQITIPITGALADLADRPVVKAAIEQARVNVANKGQAYVDAFNKAAMDTNAMPLRFWDDVKKGLDDVIGGIKRGSSNTSGSTLQSASAVKRELVGELDKLTIDPKTGSSVYKEARDAFAGPAALQSAIEDGRGALTMHPREIAKTMDNMGASEREAFQLGAADAYREKIGARAGQTNMLNAPFDRNTRQQMQEIFGDTRKYREAMSTLLAEGELKKLERTGRGSQTAGREARMEDMTAGITEDAIKAGSGAATGNIGAIVQAARSFGGRLGTPEVVRDEIGRLLMLRGVPAKEQARALDEIIKSIEMGNSRAAAIQGVLGGSLINP